MRKFFSLILVVAMLAGVSCTTDVTEDLTIGIGGKTELTVSLEGSRIALGDKVGGEYQALWSEGDKISINGITSDEAAISADNPAKATFSFEGALATPYNIVYPAAAAGKVVFASEQSFVNGTFSAGATPMYGYSESGDGVTLKHLAGVLKIGVTGSATLTYAQVSTIDRAPIAGVFDIDCATGEVTATESATEVVSYSFGDGLALSGDAQYIHLAVPAGVYNELYVTLYDSEGGVMYATVKANDEKPLNAGAVREFKTLIAYAAAENLFVIRDVASLKSYAEALAATTAEAPLTKDAVLVADIDMSGVEDWVSPSGWGASLNGNGYAIKGMTEPLFDSVTLNIKGLHLKGVDIEETERIVVGSLACYFTGELSHCSTEGTLVQNNTTYDETPLKSYQDINIGGMIGRLTKGKASYCSSDVSITLKSLSAGQQAYPTAVGGVIGATGSLVEGVQETALCYFDNLVNYGDIAYAAPAHKGNMYISAVVGRLISNASIQQLTYCTNYGSVYSTADSVISADFLLAGITGTTQDVDAETHHLNNYGEIKLQGHSNHAYATGIISYHAKAPLHDCNNYGKITISGATNGSKKNFYATGVAAFTYHDCYNICNHKEATITIENTTSANTIYIGGVIFQPHISAYTTKGEQCFKNLKNYGNINISKSSFATGHSYMGGVHGYVSASSAAADNNATWYDCANYGNITIDNIEVKGNKRLGVGGLCGARFSGIIEQCNNHGDITITNATAGQDIMVGGLDAYTASSDIASLERSYIDCNNYGDISVHSKGVCSGGSGAFFIGGIFGQIFCSYNHTYNYTRTHNHGTIEVSGVWNQSYGTSARYGQCIGGWGGDILAPNVTIKDCNNLGNVNVATTSAIDKLLAGGFIGLSYSRLNSKNITMNNCWNHATVSILPKAALTIARVGGFIGQVQDQYDYVYTVDGCGNKGEIIVGNSTTPVSIGTLYLGGLFGSICESTAAADTTTVSYGTNTNSGNITITNTTISEATASSVGGAVGITTLPIENVKVLSDIVIEGSVSKFGFVTGMDRAAGKEASNCKVGGRFAFEVKENDDGAIYYEFTALAADTFQNYIYGSGDATDWGESTNFDGCTFISEL